MSETEQILYPSVPNYIVPSGNFVVKSEAETTAMINQKLSEGRVKEMLNKKQELEKDLRHYKKVRSHWTRLDSTIKIIGTVAAVSASLGATVTATITGIPFIVPAILAGIAALDGALTEIVVVGWTSRKKKIFREKCELIQSYIDKLYIYTEKCKQDNIITIEEIENFHKLIDEYNNTIRAKRLGVKDRTEYDYEKLEKQAHREVGKDIKKELISNIKEKEIQDLKSRLGVGVVYSTLPRN